MTQGFSGPPGPPSTESADLFDYELIRDWVGYSLRSLRRHPWVALSTGLLVFGAAVGGLKAYPKTYRSESKLLAQRNQVINLLGNPGRSVPYDADAPTRAASETVLQRANLVLLVKQTDLVDNWERTRAPLVQLKDWVREQILGKPTEEDRLDALIGLLEKRLSVETGDQTVTISIEWPDAETAFRLVEAAQQNFLETRHVTEISVISEAISILEGHATTVHEQILSTMDELKAEASGPDVASAATPAATKKSDPAKPHSGSPTSTSKEHPAAAAREVAGGSGAAPATRRKPEDEEAAQLKVMLTSKQQAIKDVEEFRQHRLVELQSQLTEAKAIYAPAHPTVLNIQQSIDALSQESPQVATLRKEAAEIEGELSRRVGKADLTTPEPRRDLQSQHKDVEQALKLTRKASSDADDLSLEYTRSRLRQAMQQYDSLLDRIDGARIELDTARAAFKYRYSIIRPAEVPRNPEKPNAPVVIGLGGVLALFSALTATVLMDLRSRRIVERWQIERILGIPVLSEVNRS